MSLFALHFMSLYRIDLLHFVQAMQTKVAQYFDLPLTYSSPSYYSCVTAENCRTSDQKLSWCVIRLALEYVARMTDADLCNVYVVLEFSKLMKKNKKEHG